MSLKTNLQIAKQETKLIQQQQKERIILISLLASLLAVGLFYKAKKMVKIKIRS